MDSLIVKRKKKHTCMYNYSNYVTMCIYIHAHAYTVYIVHVHVYTSTKHINVEDKLLNHRACFAAVRAVSKPSGPL